VGGVSITNIPSLRYPNEGYRRVLAKLTEYYKEYPGVYAIVLTGSMVRNKAVTGSCIDLFVFLRRREFNALPSTVKLRERAYSRLGGEVCYYEGRVEGGIEFDGVRVDVGFADGKFRVCTENSFDITRDEFETTIGNLLVHAVVLLEKGKTYQQLRTRHVPFYDETLRKMRLEGTAKELEYKIWKTRWLAKRGEFFAALDALLEAHRIFLQHLFIKERKYPIDYVKWLEEQCLQILKMPALYQELAASVSGSEFTVKSFNERSEALRKLFAKYGCTVGF